MSNAKRFLSVILAMIMVLSTFVVGADAAYNGYKDEAITNYDELDKPHLTIDQYASAAMDEVDRMLKEEQLILEVYVLTLDLTTLDKAMDSLYNIKKSSAWSIVEGMVGDLKNLDLSAFATEADGGVRRGTAGKSEVEIVYAIFEFFYDNRNLLANFVRGQLDMGTLLPTFVDLSEFSDISKMLKGMLYETAYKEKDENGEEIEVVVPENVNTITVDEMVQHLIDRKVVEFAPNFEGKTDISTGSMYDFIDTALKVCYNDLLVPMLNDHTKTSIKEALGIVITYDDAGNIVSEDRTNQMYKSLLNVDYTIPEYRFTDATFISQLNNIIKSILDQFIFPEIFVWEAGDNSKVKTNVTNLAKQALIKTGDDFFAEEDEVATPEEIEAMSMEQLVVYILRAIIHGSTDGMYIPECNSIREVGYYTLKQLCATKMPELDFSGLDKDSTESIFVMAMNFAIYSTESQIDLGMDYALDVAGIDDQVDKAMDYAVENYAGLFSGITFDTNATGWANFNTLIFSIIPSSWLPTAANDDVKTFLMDCLIDNIFNLDFDAIFALFDERADSELQQAPKKVIANLVTRIINIIFPNAFASNVASLEQLFTNEALANTVSTLFYDLYYYRVPLVAAILPTACDILELTSLQQFEYPEYTYEKTYCNTSKSIMFDITIRNGSTGINSGYTDADGNFHQDSLYTYDFKSITPKVNGTATTSVTATVPNDLAGGEYGTIKVDGSFSADAVLSIDVTYDVLTELGTPLTETPITETLYVYLTSVASDDANTYDQSGTNLGILGGNNYIYATSLNDVFDIELPIINTLSTEQSVIPTSTYGSTTNTSYLDEAGNNYIKINNDTPTTILGTVTDDEGDVYYGSASINVFEPTEAYNLLTSEEKAAAWDSIFEAYPQKARSYPVITIAMGASAGSNKVNKTGIRLYLYNDYGLPGIVENELTAHRQAADYGATEWDNYVSAMASAVKAVYSPFIYTSFANKKTGKALSIETAYPVLVEAIEALEASAKSAGVQSLIDIISNYNPSNAGLEYDDPDYVHFGLADFVGYTYYNYRDEYRIAQDLIDKATIADALGVTYIVNSLELAYIKHRLALYGSRLLYVDVTKTHLAAELANSTRPILAESNYTADSWANYQRALTFANAVNNKAETGLKQSEVNTAYSELLNAEKLLVLSKGDTPPVDEPTFTPVSPVDGSELQVAETAIGKVLLGMFPAEDYAIENYFNCTGCYVEVVENDSGAVSTGATVNVKNSTTDELIDSYIICVSADANEDGLAGDPYDLSLVANKVGLLVEFDELITLAADLTDDGAVDATDLSQFASLVGLMAEVDYANRTITVL